jgi:hypothetical protein
VCSIPSSYYIVTNILCIHQQKKKEEDEEEEDVSSSARAPFHLARTSQLFLFSSTFFYQPPIQV